MSLLGKGAFIIHGLRNFTKAGFKSAASSSSWEDLEKKDLSNVSIMITGGNSGLGFAACQYFARNGATLHMLCRNEKKGEDAKSKLEKQHPNAKVHLHIVDVSVQKNIRDFCSSFLSKPTPVDVLINNAGVLLLKEEKSTTKEGLELTLATNVVSNFLLTTLMLPRLIESPRPRVVFVTSGGGLTEKLLIRKDYEKGKWDGQTMYARTKRHQMALAEVFAEKYTSVTNVNFLTMHPGWADTPGVQRSLPKFYDRFKKQLRTPEQGADTMCWLAVSDQVRLLHSGQLFRDRQIEKKHLTFSGTSYPFSKAQDMWKWFCELTKMDENDESIFKLANQNRKLEIEIRHLVKKMKHDETILQRDTNGRVKGSQIVEWIAKQEKLDRKEALARGQLLVDFGHLRRHADTKRSLSDDSHLYDFYPVPSHKKIRNEIVGDEWLKKELAYLDPECKDSAWQIKKEAEDYKIWSRDVENSSLRAFKVALPLTARREDIIDLLHTNMVERNAEWNSSFDSGRYLDYVSPHINVQYWFFKLGALTANRDFVVARRMWEDSDGGLVFAEKSIVHGLMPPFKDIVRCELPHATRYFVPVTDEKDKWHFLYSNITDLRGNIPTSLVNSVNGGYVLKEMKGIRDILEKEAKEAKRREMAVEEESKVTPPDSDKKE